MECHVPDSCLTLNLFYMCPVRSIRWTQRWLQFDEFWLEKHRRGGLQCMEMMLHQVGARKKNLKPTGTVSMKLYENFKFESTRRYILLF